MLGIMASQQAMLAPGLRHIEMYTGRGLLGILWHEPVGNAGTSGVVMMGGAMGGLMGPGDALYQVLGEDFSARGIPSMRISWRKPNDLDSCCVDAAAAVQMMVGTGCERVVLMDTASAARWRCASPSGCRRWCAGWSRSPRSRRGARWHPACRAGRS
jgi:hypothetical protein